MNRTTLKFSLRDIWGLCSNFIECESFLESNSPDILVLFETNLDDSFILAISQSGVIFLKGFCYSYAWSCSFCEGRTYFYRSLIFIKLCRILLIFSTYFTSLSRVYFRLFLLPDNSSKNSILNWILKLNLVWQKIVNPNI